MSNITMNNINNNPNDDLREFDFQNWSTFYADEAAKLQTFLTQFGFDKNDFLTSATCCDKFNAIINVAQELKLDERPLSIKVSPHLLTPTLSKPNNALRLNVNEMS
jgi:hypothetical protein